MKTDVLFYLETLLGDSGRQTKLVTENGIDILKVSLTGLGRSGGTAMTEICCIPVTFNGSGRQLLQIFTTFAANLDADKLDAETAAFNELNLSMTCGFIGIYRKLRQAYHKYTVLLSADENAAFRQATDALDLALGAINGVFDRAIMIADGNI